MTRQPVFNLLYLKNDFPSAHLPPPFNGYVVFHGMLESSLIPSFPCFWIAGQFSKFFAALYITATNVLVSNYLHIGAFISVG